MMLGAALQLTNAYGDVFLDEFKYFPKYASSFVIKYSTIIMSISQISETLFILAIPFFFKRFGIKQVMLISMLAWVFRFGLFGFGDPAGGLWMIILSCIVYGMAFDFFNISGSLFVETTTEPKIRSSVQGLFMMMTNGFGAVLGSVIAGWSIDRFFTKKFIDIQSLAANFDTTADNPTFLDIAKNALGAVINQDGSLANPVYIKDWHQIWIAFAAYALLVTILFALLFKNEPKQELDLSKLNH